MFCTTWTNDFEITLKTSVEIIQKNFISIGNRPTYYTFVENICTNKEELTYLSN